MLDDDHQRLPYPQQHFNDYPTIDSNIELTSLVDSAKLLRQTLTLQQFPMKNKQPSICTTIIFGVPDMSRIYAKNPSKNI